PARPPLANDFLCQCNNQIVITGDGFLMERRQDELALLLMLRTVHPRQTKANTALRGVFRAVNELTSSAKFRGIAQNLPVEFRSDCKNQRIARLFQCHPTRCGDWTMLAIKAANASHQIKKET